MLGYSVVSTGRWNVAFRSEVQSVESVKELEKALLINLVRTRQVAGPGSSQNMVQNGFGLAVRFHDSVFAEVKAALEGLDPVDHGLVGIGGKAEFGQRHEA